MLPRFNCISSLFKPPWCYLLKLEHALDKYLQHYEKFLLTEDFNAEDSELRKELITLCEELNFSYEEKEDTLEKMSFLTVTKMILIRTYLPIVLNKCQVFVHRI